MPRSLGVLGNWVGGRPEAAVGGRPATVGGRSAAATAGAAQALAVAAGKGGVGVSTLCSLLAFGAAKVGRRTLLVDAAPSGGSLTEILGLDGSAPVKGTPSGFDVREIAPRLAFTGLRTARWHGPGERQATLRRLATNYAGHDFVVIDAGATWESALAVLSAGADRLLAVTAEDRLSVVATYALIKLANERFPELPVTVVVNRCEMAVGAAAFSRIASGVESFLGRRITTAGSIPSDAGLRSSAEAGVSPILFNGPAAHAAQLLAELLSARGPRRPRTALRLS